MTDIITQKNELLELSELIAATALKHSEPVSDELSTDIYRQIADRISDSVDCDRFAGSGEIDIDKDSFVSYEFEGEGQRINYYAADSITPCQWDMRADVRVTALYVTDDGEERIDISALENYLNNNIQIFS